MNLNFLKQNRFLDFVIRNKIIVSVVSVVLVLGITVTSIFVFGGVSDSQNTNAQIIESQTTTTSDDFSSESVTSHETESEISSEPQSSSKPVSSAASSKPAEKPAVPQAPVHVPSNTGEYNYNTNLNIEDNVFMDALVYTGYNLEKHRADGNMWVYILARYKRGMGYLSNITFNGGSTGYETTADGKPDIKAFERGGLVCASFVTYVYFNYLPNVAGIDTSALPRPASSVNANDWYKAAKQWIDLGYSYSIPFDAKRTSEGYIKFTPSQEIPIGSIIIFRNADSNADYGNHAVVYAGYKNGNHWVYHVGNKNGPEMCAVERMLFGPDPVFPICVISAPSNIRMSAMIDVTLKDENGQAVKNASFTLKNTKTNDVTQLGSTNENGNITVENLSYGEHELTLTVPDGYTCEEPSRIIKLNTQNNSCNTVEFSITKVKAKTEPTQNSTTATTTTSTSTSTSTTLSSSSSQEVTDTKDNETSVSAPSQDNATE